MFAIDQRREGRLARQVRSSDSGAAAEEQSEERAAGEALGRADEGAGAARRASGGGHGRHQHRPQGDALRQQEAGGRVTDRHQVLK